MSKTFRPTKILCTGASGFVGTHLVQLLMEEDRQAINIDTMPPRNPIYLPYWVQGDILDVNILAGIMEEYKPDCVVHLAARATMEGKSLADFQANTIGTENLLNAIKNTSSVERVIVTSTQHVRKPGSGFPKNDEDFVPHGLYGESKVITEKLVRNAGLHCAWTIIRPTTIWGPLHPFLPDGLWRLMRQGMYFHPAGDPVIRAYGYVKNTAWQIGQMLTAPSEVINHRVFYLGDGNIRQIDWINAFNKALTGKDVRTVPKHLIKMLADMGDVLKKFGIPFPMYGERYFNLTTDNRVPLAPVLNLFGKPPTLMSRGIEETCKWLQSYWN